MRRGWLILLLSGTIVSLVAGGRAVAAINLELRPQDPLATVGQVVHIGVYAVSDSAAAQTLAAAEIIVSWDPLALQMLSANQSGAVPLLTSGFLAEPYNLNASLSDGDGMWIGLAPLGAPVIATPAGSLLTTLRFAALAATPSTFIQMPAQAGSPVGSTIVFDGSVPNLPVTGTLTGTQVSIVIPVPPSALLFLSPALAISRRRR